MSMIIIIDNNSSEFIFIQYQSNIFVIIYPKVQQYFLSVNSFQAVD